MVGDGIGELLGERAELIDLARQRIGEDVGIVGSSDLLQRRQAAAELGHLPGEVAVAVRELRKLNAEAGARPPLIHYHVVDRKRGKHDDRDRRRLHLIETRREIKERAGGTGHQQHAECDEDGAEAHALPTLGVWRQGPGGRRQRLIRPLPPMSMTPPAGASDLSGLRDQCW